MSSSSQQQHQQQTKLVNTSKEKLLAALANADDHVQDLQALLQSTSDGNPLQEFANELLPAILSACDVTTPQGQNRKLAALNTFWKLLLAAVTSASITASSFTDGTQFMLAQLWHGVFSHDWSDTRKSKLAAFFASHLVSAVRAHPDWVLGSPVCEGILDLFFALSEAVASGSGSCGGEQAAADVGSRAKALYTTVLVRLQGILECLGGSAAGRPTGDSGGGDGEGEEDEDEGGAAATEAERALWLLERCSAGGGSTEGAAAAAVCSSSSLPSPSRLASALFMSSSVSPLPTLIGAAEAERATAIVRSIASLTCLLHVVKGLLATLREHQQQAHPTTSAITVKCARLALLSLLQCVPGVCGTCAAKEEEEEGGLTDRERRLLVCVRQATRSLPSSALWLSSSSSWPSGGGNGKGDGDGDDVVEEPSLRALWVDNLSAALALLCCRGEEAFLCCRSLLAALATPHEENAALITEALVHAIAAGATDGIDSSSSSSGAGGSDGNSPVAMLPYFCHVGCAACAQVVEMETNEQFCKEVGKGVAASLAPSSPLPLSSSAAVLWSFASSVAVVVGGCCCAAAAAGHSACLPSSLRRGQSLADHGWFLAMADAVYLANCQDALCADSGNSDDPRLWKGDGDEDEERTHSDQCGDNPLALAAELESLLVAITEGSSRDPRHALRMLQAAPLLHRLRKTLECDNGRCRGGAEDDHRRVGGEGDSAAVRGTLRHCAQQQQPWKRHGDRPRVSPPPSLSPTSSVVAASSSSGAFPAVLRSFSGLLSTLTRVLTVEANRSHSGRGKDRVGGGALLASFAAASLLREATFFLLEEPQDQLLTACIRRWVDLGFLLTGGDDLGNSGSDQDVLCVLARHNAARSLMCFAQHNTSLPMDQLRLPEEAAVSLVKLLRGGQDGDDGQAEEEPMSPAVASLMASLASGARVAKAARERSWAASLEHLQTLQPTLQSIMLSLSRTGNGSSNGGDAKLLSTLLACKAALSRFLADRAGHDSGTPTTTALAASHSDSSEEEARGQVTKCLEEVLALGTSAAALLQASARGGSGAAASSSYRSIHRDEAGGRGPRATQTDSDAEEESDDTLTRAVRRTVEGRAQAGRTHGGQRKARKCQAVEGEEEEGASRTSSHSSHHQNREAVSRFSSSVQLLAGSQVSVDSREEQPRDDVVRIE